jgi:hypothetical protein
VTWNYDFIFLNFRRCYGEIKGRSGSWPEVVGDLFAAQKLHSIVLMCVPAIGRPRKFKPDDISHWDNWLASFKRSMKFYKLRREILRITNSDWRQQPRGENYEVRKRLSVAEKFEL